MAYLVGEHGSWYAVTNGIDVGHTGLELGVDFKPTPVVLLGGLTSDLVQIETLQVWSSPCCQPITAKSVKMKQLTSMIVSPEIG